MESPLIPVSIAAIAAGEITLGVLVTLGMNWGPALVWGAGAGIALVVFIIVSGLIAEAWESRRSDHSHASDPVGVEDPGDAQPLVDKNGLPAGWDRDHLPFWGAVAYGTFLGAFLFAFLLAFLHLFSVPASIAFSLVLAGGIAGAMIGGIVQQVGWRREYARAVRDNSTVIRING